MKVILTTGSRSAQLELVSTLLFQSGLTQAQPCRKAKLTPQALQSKLLTSLEVDLTSDAPLAQVRPGKLWDEMATDLFLANIDEPVWGWADPQTVVLLDFWRQFDPQVRLLLVYNSPASYLAQALDSVAKPTSQVIAAALDEWIRWNTALLDYQQRYPDVCTLLNCQLALDKPDTWMTKLSAQWGVSGLNASVEQRTTPDPIVQLQAHLSAQLLDAKHPAWALFQQLEAVTLLPVSTPADPVNKAVSAAWGNLTAVKATMADSRAQLALADQANLRVADLAQDKELMLLQLHQVQEELKHYFSLYQELDKKFFAKQDGFVSEFWVTHQPSELLIDMRANITGSNWHGVESDGRWAGPGKLSTLQMPPMLAGVYALTLDIVDTMDLAITTGIVIELHDKNYPLEISYPAGAGKCPVIGRATINLAHQQSKHPWAIGLRFPHLISPSDRGSNDLRFLAVRVSSLKLVKQS